jgi:hypothetical protein
MLPHLLLDRSVSLSVSTVIVEVLGLEVLGLEVLDLSPVLSETPVLSECTYVSATLGVTGPQVVFPNPAGSIRPEKFAVLSPLGLSYHSLVVLRLFCLLLRMALLLWVC